MCNLQVFWYEGQLPRWHGLGQTYQVVFIQLRWYPVLPCLVHQGGNTNPWRPKSWSWKRVIRFFLKECIYEFSQTHTYLYSYSHTQTHTHTHKCTHTFNSHMQVDTLFKYTCMHTQTHNTQIHSQTAHLSNVTLKIKPFKTMFVRKMSLQEGVIWFDVAGSNFWSKEECSTSSCCLNAWLNTKYEIFKRSTVTLIKLVLFVVDK